jgi:hypothetical protein
LIALRALAKATSEEERVIPYRRRAWRAWPEFEMMTDDDGAPIVPWGEMPPDEYDGEEVEFDPEFEVDRQAAEQRNLEEAIDAAIDFERGREKRIDAIRAAKGLPPRRRRKRMRIAFGDSPLASACA